MKSVLAAILIVVLTGTANAAVKMESVEYKDGTTTLKGQLAYDDAAKDKRPGAPAVVLNPVARARNLAVQNQFATRIRRNIDGA